MEIQKIKAEAEFLASLMAQINFWSLHPSTDSGLREHHLWMIVENAFRVWFGEDPERRKPITKEELHEITPLLFATLPHGFLGSERIEQYVQEYTGHTISILDYTKKKADQKA